MFRTVLIADGNDSLREELAWGLRAQGYRVLDARTAFEALTALTVNDVDLLVLGLDSAAIDGRKVLEAIAREPGHARLAVLLVTSRPELAPPDLAILKRPFATEVFVVTVGAMVGPPRKRALTTPIPGQASIEALLEGNDDGIGGGPERTKS